MTDAQRRTAILTLLREQTVVNTATREQARRTLINEGIYDEDGELMEAFGGQAVAHRTR